MTQAVPKLWRGPQPLVLASSSETRARILRNCAIEFEAMDPQVDERVIERSIPEGDRSRLAEVLAREKAKHVSRRFPKRIVLGADQTLSLGQRQFSKPRTRAMAKEQLMKLSGRAHVLTSSASIVLDQHVIFEASESARVVFRSFDENFADRYLDLAGESVLRSVGCYQVENLGVQLIENIEGDYFSILGLPLLPILRFMRQAEFLAT